MIKKITIYTKVCLPCVMRHDDWHAFQKSIWNAGYEIKTIRTTYDQDLHKEAIGLWGNDNYVAFVLAPNGEVLRLQEAKKMFEEIKDKMIKAGKSKPVRKGKKNVQRLPKAKVQRTPMEVDSVAGGAGEATVENESPKEELA